MRIDKIMAEIRGKRQALMEQTFKNPPSDWTTFQNIHGFWTGLGQCLSVIEEAIKDTDDEI